jgi:hypothetical protein
VRRAEREGSLKFPIRLIEFACNENNRDLPRLGFGPHEPEVYDKPQPAAK